MNICVIATASAYRGALMIYKQFLNVLEVYHRDDDWHVFVDYGMPMPVISNVNYHVCHTKGMGRIWFDLFGFRNMVKKLGVIPDVVVSLQNTGVKCNCERVIIYYHQSLPLYHYRIKLFDKSVKSNLFYLYFYPLYVSVFLNKKTFVAVQTDTIKELFSIKFRFPKGRIGVFFPEIDRVDGEKILPYQYQVGTFNFLYPSMGASYKEHISLAYAVQIVKMMNPDLVSKIKIHFTLKENNVRELKRYISANNMDSNFVFHGNIPHTQVLSMLKSSQGLLFPSVVESSGLPLLEAAMLGIPIIANDMGYVHDALHKYDGLKCVQVHNYDEWAEKIIGCCNIKECYTPYIPNDNDSWQRLFRLVKEGVIV